MSVFEHQSYKVFLREKIASYPKNGRGVPRRLSEHLGVHPTLISQILSGEKHFSAEQAHRVCDYFVLSHNETKHFMHLLQFERAGTQELRQYYSEILEEEKREAKKVGKRLDLSQSLGAAEEALYYSHWKFAATRLALMLPGVGTREEISQALGLPKSEVGKVIEKLLEFGLCEEVDGRLRQTEKVTFVNPDSDFFSQHHRNWRAKAVEACGIKPKEGLFFTAPLTCSKGDIERIRGRLLEAIQEIRKQVSESDSETMACLNIDLFLPFS